jgi:hypothetical protein
MMTVHASSRTATILVAVTFHFNEQRLPYLARTLRALSLWQIGHMRVVVFTNDARERNITKLTRLCHEILCECEIRVISGLENPWKLTWAHKGIITSEFLQGDQRFSHFLYLEDDIEVQGGNFAYWLNARELLRSKNLLPAFLRLEYEPSQVALTTSDVFWKIFIPSQSYIYINGIAWVAMPNPYNPLFIMDRELAQEYVLSRSFDETESLKVSSWGLAERAAMGLCNEGIPKGFPHRYLVPVTDLGRPLSSSQIFHIPSNYALNPNPWYKLGKIRLDELFSGFSALKPQGHSKATAFAGPRLDHPHDASQRSVTWQIQRSVQSETEACPSWTEAIELSSVNTQLLEGFFLVSHHDTIMFYDFEYSCVRQEPFGIAPLNLVVLFRDRSAQFLAIDPGKKIWTVEWGGSISPFQEDLYIAAMNFYSNGTFSVSSNGKFLTAHLNGETAWDVDWCHQFERFRLIRVDTITGLAWLRREDWIAENGELVRWHDQPFDFGQEEPSEGSALAATIEREALTSRRAFKFGTSRIFLTAIHHQTFFLDAKDNCEKPPILKIVEPEGRCSCFKRLV